MMKYTISDKNRWTTLSAYVDNQLFYGYAPDVFFDCYSSSLDIEPSPLKAKGLYPSFTQVIKVIDDEIARLERYQFEHPESKANRINNIGWYETRSHINYLNFIKDDLFGENK